MHGRGPVTTCVTFFTHLVVAYSTTTMPVLPRGPPQLPRHRQCSSRQRCHLLSTAQVQVQPYYFLHSRQMFKAHAFLLLQIHVGYGAPTPYGQVGPWGQSAWNFMPNRGPPPQFAPQWGMPPQFATQGPPVTPSAAHTSAGTFTFCTYTHT